MATSTIAYQFAVIVFIIFSPDYISSQDTTPSTEGQNSSSPSGQGGENPPTASGGPSGPLGPPTGPFGPPMEPFIPPSIPFPPLVLDPYLIAESIFNSINSILGHMSGFSAEQCSKTDNSQPCFFFFAVDHSANGNNSCSVYTIGGCNVRVQSYEAKNCDHKCKAPSSKEGQEGNEPGSPAADATTF